jgi:hypothetical protein
LDDFLQWLKSPSGQMTVVGFAKGDDLGGCYGTLNSCEESIVPPHPVGSDGRSRHPLTGAKHHNPLHL